MRLELGDGFHCVKNMEIGWFDAEKDVDYELANRSLWYLQMTIGFPGTTESQYDRAWQVFRDRGVDGLTKSLALSSWGIGLGIASRRGQDLFVVELDGFDYPEWILFISINTGDTYESCSRSAEKVEHFVATSLDKWVREP